MPWLLALQLAVVLLVSWRRLSYSSKKLVPSSLEVPREPLVSLSLVDVDERSEAPRELLEPSMLSEPLKPLVVEEEAPHLLPIPCCVLAALRRDLVARDGRVPLDRLVPHANALLVVPHVEGTVENQHLMYHHHHQTTNRPSPFVLWVLGIFSTLYICRLKKKSCLENLKT